MFDAGLITLADDYSAIVSDRVLDMSRGYGRLQGKTLRLPGERTSYPSKAAIAYHREDIFVS